MSRLVSYVEDELNPNML